MAQTTSAKGLVNESNDCAPPRQNGIEVAFAHPRHAAKLPATLAKNRMEIIDAAIALVTRSDGKLLVCQRKSDDTFGGLWEFPGGKCEDGETLEHCLRRELLEELAIRALPIARLTTIEHQYPHARIRLHPFVCRHEHGEVQHLECQASRWINPSTLRDYEFPPANDSLLAEAIDYFSHLSPAADLSGAPNPDTIASPKN
jgi:mutator protein MutT